MPRTFINPTLYRSLEEQINERERGNNMPEINWLDEMEERSRNIPEPISVNQNITIDVGALRRSVEDFRAGINTTFSTNIELYQKITGGNWFFKDKEGKECGPFDTKKQAEREYKKY